MFCHNCGKQIADGVNFCRYCGASQAIVNGYAAANVPTYQNNPQPGAQSSEYHYSYVKSQPNFSAQTRQESTFRSQPQQATQPISQPLYAQTAPISSGALLASQSCSYKVAMEGDFKKFEFGGMPEGTVEIYDDRLEFFQKSKMVKAAFGMLGSALSGKGKPDLTISGDMVIRASVTNQKSQFRFYLTDGRLAFVQFTGLTGQQDACSAMQRFLKTQ